MIQKGTINVSTRENNVCSEIGTGPVDVGVGVTHLRGFNYTDFVGVALHLFRPGRQDNSGCIGTFVRV